jgi:hypothetical protein
MSFYTVDGPAVNPTYGDLSYGNPQSTEMFPMPQPSGPVNLNRQPTTASTFDGPSPRQEDVMFPVPLTAPAMPPPTSASSYASAMSKQHTDSPQPSAVGWAK